MTFTYKRVNSDELYIAVERTRKAISLLRAKKEVDEELQIAIKRKEEIYCKKVAIYQQLIDLCGNPREVRLLRKYSKKATKEYADSIRTISEIEEVLSEWDKELENEIKYMDSFSYFDYEAYKYLMDNCNKFEQKEWEPIVLLALNHGVWDGDRELIRQDLNRLFSEGNFKIFEDSNVDLREEFINKWILSEAYKYL